MALATQCPHCGTMFRVAADQLKLRGGIVRCGACTQVFDGHAALVDLAAPSPPPRSSAFAAAGASAAPAASSPAPRSRRAGDAIPAAQAPQPEAPAAPSQETTDEPIYTLEFDRTFAPFGILPQSSAEGGKGETAPREPDENGTPAADPVPLAEAQSMPEAAPEPEPEPASVPAAHRPAAPAADLQADEASVIAAAPDHDDTPEEAVSEGVSGPAAAPAPAAATASTPASARAGASAPPLLLRESGPATVTLPLPPSAPPVAPRTPRAKAAEARAARRSKLTPTRIEPPKLRVPEPDEPEFVRRGRQRERSGKAVRIAMAVGCVLLLLVLGAQLVRSFHTPLAARYPGLKPTLVSLCGVLGCRVGLPAQIDQLVIDTGELTTLGGNAYTFGTQLRNQGDSTQAWPSIELTLLDADDKPLVRRVFGPRDYLPDGPLLASGFPAHAEQPVKLHFRVEEPAPSGYHIAVFYP
jgi:predicted Zn finger-like uncharacterized protein